jgi:periplasmic mercuric ion binding protein
MKAILFSMLALVFATVNVTQTIAGGKKEKVTIQTSRQCGECEARITKALKSVDGFKSAVFDEKNAVIVAYDAEKTNPDALRNAIASAGYDADEVPANAEAYATLPGCCQKGGH